MDSTTKVSTDEIQLIKDALKRLGEGSGSVDWNQRTILLHRLNSVQALTKHLPTEIMSRIFMYVCSPPFNEFDYLRHSRQALILGCVSFDWRQISRSTPEVWTIMSVTLTKMSSRSLPHLLRLHVTSVGDLPLTIHIEFIEVLDSAAEALYQILEENGEKVHSLHLMGLPAQLAPLLSNGALSQLKELSILGSSTNKLGFPLANLPRLSMIFLLSVTPVSIELEWENITVLLLSGVQIGLCARVLSECSNLILASITSPENLASDTLPPTSTSITLPVLLDLTITICDDPVNLALLKRVQAPSLQRLVWMHSGRPFGSKGFPPPMKTFIRNLPSSMSTLELNSLTRWKPRHFIQLFAQASQVKMLFLENCDIVSLRNFFRVPLPSPNTTHLPALKLFTVGGCIKGEEDELLDFKPELMEMVVELLRRQWRSGVHNFFLEFADDVSLDWDMEALSSMAKDGFNLEFWQKNEKADWSDPSSWSGFTGEDEFSEDEGSDGGSESEDESGDENNENESSGEGL